jgi:DNA invertase Pin-like site-specific DNA recombinase
MPSAAVYLRLSTIDQDQDVAALSRQLHEAAERLGYTVTLNVRETPRGQDKRSGLRRVVTAARRGDIEAVFVWKLDSLGAMAADVQRTVATFAGFGARVVVTSHGLDFRPEEQSVVGELMLRMLAALSEFESYQHRLQRARVSEGTRLGIERAREQGKQLGRPRVERPDPERVLKLRKRRKSWPAIAEELGVSRHAARTALPPGTDPMLDLPPPTTKKRRPKHKAKPRRKRQRATRRQ